MQLQALPSELRLTVYERQSSRSESFKRQKLTLKAQATIVQRMNYGATILQILSLQSVYQSEGCHMTVHWADASVAGLTAMPLNMMLS